MMISFAIVDLPLEEGEITFIALLVLGAFVAALTILRLSRELKRQQARLKEQEELNKKLDSVVERLMKIDAAGGIDSNKKK